MFPKSPRVLFLTTLSLVLLGLSLWFLHRGQRLEAAGFALAIWVVSSLALRRTRWAVLALEGNKAYKAGRYPEAEEKLAGAVKEAEKFGPKDARLSLCLNDLAAVYLAQGRYAEAEANYRRSLEILEQAKGPEHPNVADRLNN